MARGIISSDYIYNPNEPIGYVHTHKVHWTYSGKNWNLPISAGYLPIQAFCSVNNDSPYWPTLKRWFEKDITSTDLPILRKLSNKSTDPAVDSSQNATTSKVEVKSYSVGVKGYSKKDFLHDVFMQENDYDQLVSLLKYRKNIILQGPPGVGKTFTAKCLAWSLLGSKDQDRLSMVQFHQNTTYEDFIQGYRPDGKGGFIMKNGHFYQFCQKAKSDPAHDYFFVIDEINRGNLSKIFGEMLMLIESDKRGAEYAMPLLYSEELFEVPSNLYLIGMMNTADRSLSMIDYALRRRFAFFDFRPAFKLPVFEKYVNNLISQSSNSKIASNLHSLLKTIQALNEDIAQDESLGQGYCIGHSYFCTKPQDFNFWLNSIVNFEIIPLLKEYWFDNRMQLEAWTNKLQQAIR